MKVKEIVGEGVVSSFAKGLLPNVVQKVIDTPLDLPGKGKGDTNLINLAKAAYKKFGANPGLAGLPDEYGYLGYLNSYELSNQIALLPYHVKAKLPPDLKTRLGLKV